ncbi:hypothetical protein BGZ94_005869, partial [Podila epigama]
MNTFSSTTATKFSPRMLKTLLLLVASSCCLGLVAGNVVFADIPANTRRKPGETIEISWTVNTPSNPTQASSQPFKLTLRAATKQVHDIQDNIPQTNSTLRVTIPVAATGGNHSFYAEYPDTQSKQISGRFWIDAPIVSSTAAPPSSTDPAQPAQPAPAADTGMSGAALAGIIGGVVVILLGVALIFYFRHRRRIAERVANSHKPEESKEGFGNGAYSKNGDKESLTRSAGSGGGPVGNIGAPVIGGLASGGASGAA